jgi:hypothetical protein
MRACHALIQHNVVLDVVVIENTGASEVLPLVRLTEGQIFRVNCISRGKEIVNQDGFLDTRLRAVFSRKAYDVRPSAAAIADFMICDGVNEYDREVVISMPFKQNDPLVLELPQSKLERTVRLRSELNECRQNGFHVFPLLNAEEWAWRAFVFGSKVWWDFVIVFPGGYPRSAPSIRSLSRPEVGTSRTGFLDANVIGNYREQVKIVEVLQRIREVVQQWREPAEKEKGVRYLKEIRYVMTLCPANQVLKLGGKQ